MRAPYRLLSDRALAAGARRPRLSCSLLRSPRLSPSSPVRAAMSLYSPWPVPCSRRGSLLLWYVRVAVCVNFLYSALISIVSSISPVVVVRRRVVCAALYTSPSHIVVKPSNPVLPCPTSLNPESREICVHRL
jgi:hypothetical protein